MRWFFYLLGLTLGFSQPAFALSKGRPLATVILHDASGTAQGSWILSQVKIEYENMILTLHNPWKVTDSDAEDIQLFLPIGEAEVFYSKKSVRENTPLSDITRNPNPGRNAELPREKYPVQFAADQLKKLGNEPFHIFYSYSAESKPNFTYVADKLVIVPDNSLVAPIAETKAIQEVLLEKEEAKKFLGLLFSDMLNEDKFYSNRTAFEQAAKRAGLLGDEIEIDLESVLRTMNLQTFTEWREIWNYKNWESKDLNDYLPLPKTLVRIPRSKEFIRTTDVKNINRFLETFYRTNFTF